MILPPTPANWRPPPGLILLGWLYWGRVWDYWWIAIPAGLLCESYRLVKQRWAFEESDYVKLWNACMIMTLVVLSYNLFNDGLDETFYLALKWAPLLFLPFAISQLYGEQESIPILTITVLARRRRRLDEAAGRQLPPMKRMHLGYPMLALLMMSTGGRTVLHQFGYGLLVALVMGIAIWHNRDRLRRRPILTAVCMGAVLLIAAFSTIAIQHYGRMLQSYSSNNNFKYMPPDPSWSNTRIGQVGQLKMSHALHWVLKPGDTTPPRYLREASYVGYGGGNWFNHTLNNFSRLGDPPLWEINPGAGTSSVTIRGRPGDEVAVLPMPYAPGEVSRLQADALRTNQLNAVQGFTMSTAIEYKVSHAGGQILDSPPIGEDLGTDVYLFGDERIEQLTREIWSPKDSPEERLRAIVAFFQDGFRYTMFQPIRGGRRYHNGRALIPFLTQHRSGHCEYYATATAQLLRYAGIPTRYSVGYAVAEYDERRKVYNLRARHRHAWCQAWVDNQWVIIDTTPADWLGQERKSQPMWQPLRDRLSTLYMAMTLWQNSPLGKRLLLVLSILLGTLLLLYLFIRIILGKRSTAAAPTQSGLTSMGMDSEFFAVLSELEHSPAPISDTWRQTYAEAHHLHDAYRFDPNGLKPDERESLKQQSMRCIDLLNESGSAM